MAPPKRATTSAAGGPPAPPSGVLGALLPVQLANTIPFEPIKIQTSVLEAQTLEIMPVTGLSNPVSMIEFIARPQDYYLDLTSIILKLKCVITKSDGTGLANDDTTSGVVNNLPGSMINRIECFLNEKAVQLCCDHYGLRSYLELIMFNNAESAQTKLQTNIFALDTAGKTDKATAENLGWTARRLKVFKTGKGAQETTVLHRLHLDISSCSDYFINGLTLRIRIIMHDSPFYMFNTGTEKTKMKINEASLLLRTKVLTPELILQNEARLAVMNARYAIKRVDLRTFVTPSSGRKISVPNVFLGPQPQFIALCLLKSESYAGTHLTNPFEFFHQKISSVSVYLNNSCMTVGPCDADDYAAYVPYYQQFIDALSLNGDCSTMITYEQFIGGYFLICFDCSADKQANVNTHLSLPMTGSLRIEVDLSSALTENMVLACYGIFSGLLEITKDRVVNVE